MSHGLISTRSNDLVSRSMTVFRENRTCWYRNYTWGVGPM